MKTVLTTEQQKRVDALMHMNPQQWDAICKQCGICCLAKMEMPIKDNPVSADDVKTIYLRQCCENFDKKTCKCSIYETRFDNKYCKKVDINVVLENKLLPASCGYVEYIFGPAEFPARVDFNQVRPVSYDEETSQEQLIKDVIKESVFWNRHER